MIALTLIPGRSGLVNLLAPRWEDQAGACVDLPKPSSSSQEETELGLNSWSGVNSLTDLCLQTFR